MKFSRLNHTLCFALLAMCLVLVGCTTPPEDVKARHDTGGGTTMQLKGNCPDGRDCRACVPTNQIFIVPPNANALRVSYTLPSGGSAVGPFTYILKSIRDRLQSSTQAIVTAIVTNTDFKNTTVALLALVIAIYFLFVLTGGASAHISDILTVMIRVLVVFYLVSDYNTITAWTRDFGETVVNDLSALFLANLSTLTTTSATAAELAVSGMMDRFINMFLTMEFFEFLLAMALHGAVGFGFVIMILVMFVFYVAAALKVLYYLILAMVVRYFLYAIAPIFFLGLMFRQTRSFFDNWVAQLINFVAQAVLLVAFISIMHELLIGIMDFMARALAPDMCYMAWVSIPAPSSLIGADSWYNFYRFQFVDATNGLPVVKTVPSPALDYLTDILVAGIGVFLCMFMFLFSTFVLDIARHISSGSVLVKSNALDGMLKSYGGALGMGLGAGGKQMAGNLAKGDIMGAVGGAGSGFSKGFMAGKRGGIGGGMPGGK